MKNFQKVLKSASLVTTAPKCLSPHGVVHLLMKFLLPHLIQSSKV